MKQIKSLLRLLLYSSWFYLMLVVVALISYGQMISMNFYQDDSALVFKLTHLSEPAGNLGRGIFGQGPYRFTITPYLPIFHFFGYNPKAYYFLDLILIVASVFSVYIFFLYFLRDKLKSRLTALLFAAGYAGSDSLIRIFNSPLTALSIIFSCGAIGFYYQYYKRKKLVWYLCSIISFFLAVYFGVIRTHYLIFVVLAFEIIFFLVRKYQSFNKFFSSLIVSLLRLTPFLYLFQKFILADLDARSNQGISFLQSLIHGELYKTYSLFTTLGNMILSNQIFPKIYSLLEKSFNINLIPRNIIAIFLLILLVLLFYLYKNQLLSKKATLAFLSFISAVLIVSRMVFSYHGLLLNINNNVSLFTGIFFLLTTLIFLKILPHKKIALLFLFWMIVNLLLYAAYLPTSPLTSDDRYITHSVVPLIGLLSLWSVDLTRKLKGKKLSYLPVFLILIWGVLNLISAVSWHSDIINHRSNPSKRFFSELQTYYPTIPKKSLFYFYIPDKPFAHAHYDSGFGVGQMPNETAIAWRYGVDRYDLIIVNSFNDLKKQVKENKIPLENIFAFIADPDNLIDTTNKTRSLLKDGSDSEDKNTFKSETKLNISTVGTSFEINPLEINPENILSLTDLKLTLKIAGEPLPTTGLNFPVKNVLTYHQFSKETMFSAFDYQDWQEAIHKTTQISSNNLWLDHQPNLSLDGNPETFWQGDRIEWSKNKSNLILDLGQVTETVGIKYKNGPSSLSPTKFEILSSVDGKDFQRVTVVSRSYSDQLSYDLEQIVNFDPIKSQYLKLSFLETSSNDSPALAEIEIIPEKFKNIDHEEIEKFLEAPFNYVESIDNWETLMNHLGTAGKVQFFWKTDGSDKWRSKTDSFFTLNYDSQVHDIEMIIPSEGHYLKELKIVPKIPGKLILEQIKYQNIPLFK